jgi:riboflavin biosynthesis pyrimidine reductase
LLEADVVDELNLMIEPIVLGDGTAIFATNSAARRFVHASATTAGRACRSVGSIGRAQSGHVPGA